MEFNKTMDALLKERFSKQQAALTAAVPAAPVKEKAAGRGKVAAAPRTEARSEPSSPGKSVTEDAEARADAKKVAYTRELLATAGSKGLASARITMDRLVAFLGVQGSEPTKFVSKVKELQAGMGIKDDGIFGPKTYKKLLSTDETAFLALTGITPEAIAAAPTIEPEPTKETVDPNATFFILARANIKGKDVTDVPVRLVATSNADGYITLKTPKGETLLLSTTDPLTAQLLTPVSKVAQRDTVVAQFQSAADARHGEAFAKWLERTSPTAPTKTVVADAADAEPVA